MFRIPVLQGVDLSEMVGHSSIVASHAYIAIPTGCGFEVSGTFGKTLQAFVLVHLHRQSQGGDL